MQKYFDYHNWATTGLCEMLSDIDEEIMEKEISSSFPSLKLTLAHMAWAESIWLNRINGSTPKMSWEEWKSLTTDEIISNYSIYNQKVMDVFQEQELSKVVTYRNTKGIEYKSTIEEIGVHLVNHGSYHRGQIVTLLRQNNFTDILAFDFIAFLRT